MKKVELVKHMKLSMKFLILTLLSFTMIGTFVGSIASSIISSSNHLKENYLAENQYYAEKLAATANLLFKDMFKSLEVAANDTSFKNANANEASLDLNNLLQSTSYFNSTWYVDASGSIVATAPDINFEGRKLSSSGAMEALEKKMPLVSEPYTGATGRLMILVSVPVTDQSGLYAGYLGGTIYLEEYNSLKTVLGQHPLTGNKSYVYVVDQNGTIIYHPNKNFVNKNVQSNVSVQEVMKGKTGSLQGENSEGIDMLAGYAPTAASIGWGIISQTPVNTLMEPTTELVKKSILNMIPFMIFILVFSIIFLTRIVHPIRDLALYAQNISRNKPEQIKKIPAWYFEARELKRAILVTVEHYQARLIEAESESKWDQLTGLYNRRALDKMIEDINQYSLILFDIDYFKSVNDQYGHLMGDQVLRYTAETIMAETKNTDFCFRWGGEEFLILLPETKQEEAYFISERIRETFARTLSPIDKPITISAGVGTLYETSDYFSELLHLTDQALYEAKHSGRNTTIKAKNIPKLK